MGALCAVGLKVGAAAPAPAPPPAPAADLLQAPAGCLQPGAAPRRLSACPPGFLGAQIFGPPIAYGVLGIFIILMVLAYKGYVNLNWSTFASVFRARLDVNQDG
jgi:hypothetical protein